MRGEDLVTTDECYRQTNYVQIFFIGKKQTKKKQGYKLLWCSNFILFGLVFYRLMLQFCFWWKTIFGHTALVIQDYHTSSYIASSPGYVVFIMADGSTDEIIKPTMVRFYFFYKKKTVYIILCS